jgi:hypothetical protein
MNALATKDRGKLPLGTIERSLKSPLESGLFFFDAKNMKFSVSA